MLEKYKVVTENKEAVLYLYVNLDYEFSEELDHQSLEEKAKNWIQTHNIQFQGNKVVFVVDGIISKVMNLKQPTTLQDNESITLENGKTMSLQEVLLSLLFTNITIDLPLEVLKAVILLYRSEILKLKENHIRLSSTHSNFSFTPFTYYKISCPLTYQHYEQIYIQAIKETSGQYLVYQNEKIEAYIHMASNGYTETKPGIPYLIKRESFWDFTYPYYLQIRHFSLDKLRRNLQLSANDYTVTIQNISQSNRIKALKIGDKVLSAQDIRIYLDLPSSDATILVARDGLTFVTRGVGHGLGLSLWGAKALAELGCNAKQILGYYFQGLTLILPTTTA